MNESITTQIREAEEQLRLAMLHSDVSMLDRLLAPDVIYTNHLGQLLTKQDDLAAHQAGELYIKELSLSEQSIRVVGDVAIATVRVQSSGSYADSRIDGDFRFTRVWALSADKIWQIVTAHCSAVA